MPIIQVSLIEGRGTEAKSRLIRLLTDATVQAIGASPESVRVILQEVPAENWGVGGVPRSKVGGGQPEPLSLARPHGRA